MKGAREGEHVDGNNDFLSGTSVAQSKQQNLTGGWEGEMTKITWSRKEERKRLRALMKRMPRAHATAPRGAWYNLTLQFHLTARALQSVL